MSEIKYPLLDLGKVNSHYHSEIAEAMARVLDSGRYIGGEEVEKFEKTLATICHTPHAIGVSNGLDALRLIFRAYKTLGVFDDGDEVIVPDNTFIASVLAISDNRLTPVLADVSAKTMNLDTDLLEKYLSAKTRAILTVHLYGCPCFNKKMVEFARSNNLLIIEDNAQALGALAEIKGMSQHRTTGGLGDAAAFSFYPTKNIGALGDAGAVTTHDGQLAKTIRCLANYGTDKAYHNIYTGLNCRLDPLQAAIISAKLPQLDKENTRRNTIAAIYSENITNPALKLPSLPLNGTHVWHQYVVQVANRDRFRHYMLENGVETGVHYPVAIHSQPCYSQYSELHLPVASQLAQSVVSLPISLCTSESDAKEIAAIINNYKA